MSRANMARAFCRLSACKACMLRNSGQYERQEVPQLTFCTQMSASERNWLVKRRVLHVVGKHMGNVGLRLVGPGVPRWLAYCHRSEGLSA